MKIRHGFVSNSSSSNFIVAFPRMPKTAKEVLEFMFNGKEGGVGIEYYNDGLSYNQVAKNVFNDISLSNAKKGTLKRLVEIMRGRYYYHTNSGCVTIHGEFDEGGGSWSYKRGRYFGSNVELMELIKKATIERKEAEYKLNKREREIIASSGIVESHYAYKGGVDSYTNKPYTTKQIEAYEKYQADMKNFKKTNRKYLNFEKQKSKIWREKWDNVSNAITAIAEADAKNFLADNKGKYVFVADYGDEDGSIGAIMEHGNIFRNVPHIHISNH